MTGPQRNTRVAARLWWALLPYIGYYCDGTEDWRWWMRPARWLWVLVDKLPGSAPYPPLPPVVCTCDYCMGVPEAVFEP
jgi:hypothetical protein